MKVTYLNAYLDGIVDLEDLIIGQLLRQKRRGEKVTLTQLQQRIKDKKNHIAISQISAIENIGKNYKDTNSTKNIRRITLRKILEGLGIDYKAFQDEVNLKVAEVKSRLDEEEQKKKSLQRPSVELLKLLGGLEKDLEEAEMKPSAIARAKERLAHIIHLFKHGSTSERMIEYLETDEGQLYLHGKKAAEEETTKTQEA